MTQPPFWQPATERPQLWRTALGLLIVFGVWIAVSMAILLIAAQALEVPLWLAARARTWPTAAAFFLGFAGFHIGLALVLPLLHRRGYATLFGPARHLNMRHFGIGALVAVAIAAALYGVMGIEHLVLPEGISPPVVPARAFGPWLAGLIPALALIALQTLAEEAVFRGYLLQQLRARFRPFVIWGIGPSLLFGILHFDPGTYGPVNAAVYALNVTVIGMLAALITLRTGNLAASAGLHFGNNAALAFVGLKGTLDGFSLFVVDLDVTGGYMSYSILGQTAVMTLVFLLWWRWMARHRPIAKTPDRA